MDGEQSTSTNKQPLDFKNQEDIRDNDDYSDKTEQNEEKTKEETKEETKETEEQLQEIENKEEHRPRDSWGHYLQFIFSCLGCAVGLGNVWRFPYLCYKHGGGTFLIPYFTMLILLGAPGFFLEVSLGQYSAQGPISCWEVAPLFRGLGFAGVIVSFFVACFYCIVISWALYYLYASFTINTDLEWDRCRGEWKTPQCRNLKSKCVEIDNQNCNHCGFWFNTTDDTCGKNKNSNESTILSGYEYFNNYVRGQTKEFVESTHKLTDLGDIQLHLFVCLTILWIVICLILVKGIRLMGNVACFNSLAPYVLLTVLLVQGAIQDGAAEGIHFYLNPDFSKLLSGDVWVDAATQCFFSLSLSMGGLVALSSYNKFHNNVLQDTIIVVIGNSVTSIFSGFVIFSYIGFLSKGQGVEIKEFATAGPSLVFGVYPMAVSLLPAPQVWSGLFFLTLISLGFNSMLVLVQTTVTALQDVLPSKFHNSKLLIPVLCLIPWVVGTPMTFQGGFRMFNTMDGYAASWNSILVAVLQFTALAHVYGCKRWLDDIGVMIGADKQIMCIPWKLWRRYWFVTWCLISPMCGICLIVIVIVKSATKSEEVNTTHWSLAAFGYTLMTASLSFIIGTMIYDIITTPGSLMERLKTLTTPAPGWGHNQRMNLINSDNTEFKKDVLD